MGTAQTNNFINWSLSACSVNNLWMLYLIVYGCTKLVTKREQFILENDMVRRSFRRWHRTSRVRWRKTKNLKPQERFRIIISRYLNDPFRWCASDGRFHNIVLFNMVINWIYVFGRCMLSWNNMRLWWWWTWKSWGKVK